MPPPEIEGMNAEISVSQTGPRIKTVAVTYGRKFNLGDYNSAEVAVQLWADIDDDSDLDKAMRQLWGMAKENVRSAALPILDKQAAKVKEMYLGLPVEVVQAAESSEQAPAPKVAPAPNPAPPKRLPTHPEYDAFGER